jgi:DNA-binding NarL/FixJ family response regulator
MLVSRALVAEITPPILHEGGLAAGLKCLSHWMFDKYPLQVDMLIQADATALSEDVQVFLFEAVRELLLNVVKQSGTYCAKVQLAARLKPDVILMDVSMPVVDGIEATRIIHRTHPEIAVIGLSMFEDQDRAQAMRQAGACDYKTKGCAVPELLSAIRGCVSAKIKGLKIVPK